MTRNDKTRVGIAFGIGILAGSALGLYLNSDKGRKARKVASDKITEFGDKASVMAREKADKLSKVAHEKADKLSKVAHEQANKLSEGVAHTVDRSRKWVDDVSDRIIERMTTAKEETEELVEETESHLKSGMSKARRKIDKKAKNLQDNLN